MTDIKTLIEGYFAGELSEMESRELSKYLIDSPDTRRMICEYAQREVLLKNLVQDSPPGVKMGAELAWMDATVSTHPPISTIPASPSQKSSRVRWIGAGVCALLVIIAGAAILPPVRAMYVLGWKAGCGILFKKEGPASNAGTTQAEAKPLSRPAQKLTASPKSPAASIKPLPKPVLKDNQTISSWKWDKFQWQAVDAELVRPVTFPITVPPGHRFITVVVDNEKGFRVRNLLDSIDVSKLGGNPAATEPQTITVEWNGLNDDGQTLEDGTYHIRGCSHPGMKLIYEYSFLNPGTPPWEHYPNSGWGGDHGFPHAIACLRGHHGGDWRVAIGGTVGEGGTASFVIDVDDRKCKALNNGWNGAKALAAADGMLWICESGSKYLYRITYHDSLQVAFRGKAGATPTLKFDVDPWAIAVGKNRAAVLLHDEKQPQKERLVVFDKDSGDNQAEVPLPVPGRRNGLAFAADGTTLLVSTNSGMVSLDPEKPQGGSKPFTQTNIVSPGPLATDVAGNLYVLDRGPDYRVKVFSPDGKPLREVGTKGGQGNRLDWDGNALHGVEAISVDDDGNLWVAENGDQDTPRGRGFVRRIAVWDKSGHFVKDFVGTTWYAANNTCLHEQDPTLALAYGVIYKLEPGKKPGYRPLRFLTQGQPDGAPFWHWTGAPHTLFGSVRLFRSNVSGIMREYVLQSNGFPILFQANKGGEYRPIVAIASHEINSAFPQVKDEPKALFLWTDLNSDSLPQQAEFQRLEGSTYRADVGWGYPPSQDLVWYIEGIELKPRTFTEQGVPVYDVAKAKRLPTPQLYLPVGKHLLAGLGGKFNSPRDGVFTAGHHLFTDHDGIPVAKYRCNWPAVHASWSSTPGYTPGQTGRSVGELFFAGIVDANPDLGHVVAIQGNYGQSFLWSEDGLFVTALFKDTRQNPKGWGSREVVGADWSDITLMSECFGGWFGKQADGKTRYMFGRNGCHVVRVEGLEAVQRFNAGTVKLQGPTLQGKTLSVTNAPERVLRVPDVRGRFPPFKINGETAEWKGIERRDIKIGNDVSARVAVAHSLEHLWILAEIEDPSPWKNGGTDPKLAFKNGDAIELSVGPERPLRDSPIAGDIRVVIVPRPQGAVAIAYRPVKTEAKAEESYKFESPGKLLTFDSVAGLGEAQVAFKTAGSHYTVEVRLSCDQIELRQLRPGLRLRGDIGVLWGNEAGLVTERRAYLFNHSPEANIVSDTPSEAALHPSEWGTWLIE
jgi:sugar lactone lactonase YvrE